MKSIKITNIYKKQNKIEYGFVFSEELCSFFSGNDFIIEYPEDISSVPDAVLAIPFVCNVLPIIWLEDAELILPELDEDFYKSIPEFKKGYINMYPDAEFKGKVTVEQVVNCRKKDQNGTGAFFSGGLDATTTLLRHLDEKPDLISIWGSDIAYDNADGWRPIQNAIDEVASEYQLNHINIHSSFRQFDNEGELEKVYRDKLHDGWWHGVKHGIGLLGHAAPYAWLHSLSTVYIASSNSPTDGKVTCASHPSIDSFVRFCGVEVVHDGFELSRQGKAKYIVSYLVMNPEKKISLHVCWESADGNNCCHCEKCYRTMIAIWAEGGEPENFGLNVTTNILKTLHQKMALEYGYSKVIAIQWNQIKQGMLDNRKWLKDKPYYKNIKWIESFNFDAPEKNWCRKWYHFRQPNGIRGKLAEFPIYQKLHRIKERIKMSDFLYPLRRWHGSIVEKRIYWNYLNFPIGSKSFIVGTPEHSNIGDSAIVIAEKKFLLRCYGKEKHIKELTFNEYPRYHSLISKLISPNSHFFGHGGGNMGDQWYREEKFRREFITGQKEFNPVILPQTIYYSSSEKGQQKQEESIAIYNNPNLLLVAREKKSFEIMQNLYPKANILLTPDIVLSTTMSDYGAVKQGRKGVLLCVRNDAEKSVSDDVWLALEAEVEKAKLAHSRTDMHSDCHITKENRAECVRKKMQEFCGAELVITDRLHGMIFAAITGTPCIVFSNYNQKVKGTYDWISYLPYVRYVETKKEAIAIIPKLLAMRDCEFDNTPLMHYYEKLEEVVKEKCPR